MHRIHKSAFALMLTLSLLFVAAGSATAQPGTLWTVTAASGEAGIKAPQQGWRPLQRGQTVNPGDRIVTGDDGNVVVTRGTHEVFVAANSSFEIRPTDDSLLTRIVQKFGTLMFKVEKRRNKHFYVDTPYLHAVVKGTTFTVNVDTNGAAVHVTEGLVEVANPGGDQKILVHPGRTASIAASPGSSLQIGVYPEPAGGTNNPHRIKADLGAAVVDIEKASNGLVRRHATKRAANHNGKPGAIQTASLNGSETGENTDSGSENSAGAGNTAGLGKGQSNGIGLGVGGLPPGLGGAVPGLALGKSVGGSPGLGNSIGRSVGQSASNGNSGSNGGNGNGKGKGKGKNK